LFENFNGYIKYFLLDDLVDDNQKIKFYLPFNDFKSPPKFSKIDDYLLYKKRVANFIKLRNENIENHIRQQITKSTR
jgi:hypothetical protein